MTYDILFKIGEVVGQMKEILEEKTRSIEELLAENKKLQEDLVGKLDKMICKWDDKSKKQKDKKPFNEMAKTIKADEI